MRSAPRPPRRGQPRDPPPPWGRPTLAGRDPTTIGARGRSHRALGGPRDLRRRLRHRLAGRGWSVNPCRAALRRRSSRNDIIELGRARRRARRPPTSRTVRRLTCTTLVTQAISGCESTKYPTYASLTRTRGPTAARLIVAVPNGDGHTAGHGRDRAARRCRRSINGEPSCAGTDTVDREDLTRGLSPAIAPVAYLATRRYAAVAPSTPAASRRARHRSPRAGDPAAQYQPAPCLKPQAPHGEP